MVLGGNNGSGRRLGFLELFLFLINFFILIRTILKICGVNWILRTDERNCRAEYHHSIVIESKHFDTFLNSL